MLLVYTCSILTSRDGRCAHLCLLGAECLGTTYSIENSAPCPRCPRFLLQSWLPGLHILWEMLK